VVFQSKSELPGAVALVGVTASGKSETALTVARALGEVEIVSVDSMCVYRGMDIGTAKPTVAVRAEIPHHLIDLVEVGDEFTVSQFQDAARTALDDIGRHQHRALLVGGTGLYLRSVIDDLTLPGRWPDVSAQLEKQIATGGPDVLRELWERLNRLDPVAASRTTPTNERRIVRALEVTVGSGRPFSSFGPGLESYPPSRFTLIGLHYDQTKSDRRIAERFEAWMSMGLLEEVRRLRDLGMSRTARQALGYKELLGHLDHDLPLQECVDEAIRRTKAFARRQWHWFRRDPRIHWVEPDENPQIVLIDALRAHG
jgi:tRNA dimethylallyltransferase